MLRIKPTVISLTAGEVKDAETRRRFRRHLRRADAAQQHQGPMSIHQNRESALMPKDGPNTAATQDPGRVLTSSPPQSPAVPGRWSAPVLASPDRQQQHAGNYQGSEAPVGQFHPEPRPLAMSPRRFPHALSAESLQRRDTQRERPGGFIHLPPSSFVHRPRMDDASALAGGVETAQRGPTEVATLSAPESSSPPLPPPFSHTPRVTSGEVKTPMYVDTVDSDSDQEQAEASGTRGLPPATPVRRSSLTATARRLAISETQGEPSLTHAFEQYAEDVSRTSSRRIQSTNRHHRYNMPSTQHASDEQREADVMPPSTRARMSPFQIYNDSLPASSPLDISTPTTSRAWRQEARQNATPAGLQTPGFLGLYGGIENSDEAALFEHADRAVEARASRMGNSLSFDL
ncbi:hypothetical protein GE09DRAFT_1079782 [Coniochaeta sp. 2T2.1]|nr:hypothetical protein GE09DRAFT_1079782 [Coniochaeta sp. 2T2.1]